MTEIDWGNIPTEDLDTIFKGNVLEAIYFIAHNRIRLEHRTNLDAPWKDEWDKGMNFNKFMYYVVCKGHRAKEPARLHSYMMKFWRLKQPNAEEIKNTLIWT